MSSWEELADVLYGGIKPDIPGHGGEECASYLPKSTMLLETAITTAMMLVVAVLGWWTYTMPSKFPVRDDHLGKRFLLAALCLVFGLEVGYKVCSRQVLYLLNPCHVITMIEIYLLAAKPGRVSFSVLRILVHYVYGAVIAMVFPDTQCRFLPGEVIVYWTQHTMIFFVVPPYLIYIWGRESLEPYKEWAWAFFSGILFGVHNHYILQPVALLTHVNLNYVLCPGTVVPFSGPYYRLAAVFHQAACLLVLGKLYTVAVRLLLRLFPAYNPPTKVD